MQLRFKSNFHRIKSLEYLTELFSVEDDFKTDVDLRVACLILDKQVKLINGNEANILIPKHWLKTYLDDQAKPAIDPPKPDIKSTTITTVESQSKREEKEKIVVLFCFVCFSNEETETPKIVNAIAARPRVLPKNRKYLSTSYSTAFFRSFLEPDEQNVCVLCLTTERQVACLPCGHLTSCVACGHSLKVCPICRAAVKAFVRIYI